ncbi:MBL fold metallo-hydrolase [soil metagenome]
MADLEVAREWFSVTRVDDAITRINEPFADPWISANSWHIRGRDRDLLIDTGLGVSSLLELVSQLADREPVVVVTHAHLDHLGSAHEFSECWSHALEPTEARGQGTLSGRRLLEILGAEDDGDDPPTDPMLTAIPHFGYNIDAYELHPVVPTRRLEDGDIIDLGDRTLSVVHLPGHTPGSIGLLDASNRTLFSGDVVYDPPVLLDNLIGSNAADYAASMRRLLDLEIDLVHAGYADSFDGPRLRAIIREYLGNSSR